MIGNFSLEDIMEEGLDIIVNQTNQTNQGVNDGQMDFGLGGDCNHFWFFGKLNIEIF